MENANFVIVTDKLTIETLIENVLRRNLKNSEGPNSAEFQKDRITKSQAAKLAGICIPTLDKQIKLGRFKQYSIGKRKYFLKSEIIESLRKEVSHD